MSNYINALKAQNKDRIPVWFMRQAGRYLPEYMELKDKYDFKTRTHTPDLVKTISLQPLERYDLDAIILFSDILTCLEFMGAEFKFNEGGPKLEKSGADVLQGLSELNPQDLSFVIDGIKLIVDAKPDKPLIGFCGAPFTMASYVVEGGTSREFLNTRRFMHSNPKAFLKAMDLLADSISNYLVYQVENGAQSVQVFDSWVGILSEDQYEKFILPSMQRLISNFKSKANVPLVLYSQPTLHILPQLMETGADAFSVDWRSPIEKLGKVLDYKMDREIAIQGNLDPVLTTQDFSIAKPAVDAILQSVERAGFREKFVFNVGHGVTPFTKTETLAGIIETVHAF
ncbi:MAG: uroporphyrinogen decarboxylase [Bdellovibrionota bacterium]|nr:uroporphyrinogen decarboxylase [Bdellovibrionota bacterium]